MRACKVKSQAKIACRKPFGPSLSLQNTVQTMKECIQMQTICLIIPVTIEDNIYYFLNYQRVKYISHI